MLKLQNLDAVIDKLASIKANVNSDSNVNDRRSCKDAVKRANSLSSELGAAEAKLAELEKIANEMEKDGHFDRDRIRERSVACTQRPQVFVQMYDEYT